MNTQENQENQENQEEFSSFEPHLQLQIILSELKKSFQDDPFPSKFDNFYCLQERMNLLRSLDEFLGFGEADSVDGIDLFSFQSLIAIYLEITLSVLNQTEKTEIRNHYSSFTLADARSIQKAFVFTKFEKKKVVSCLAKEFLGNYTEWASVELFILQLNKEIEIDFEKFLLKK